MIPLAEQKYEDASATRHDEDAVASQFVTFTCNGRAFGIEIMSVREIRIWSPTTQLPNQPFGALGVLDIRGEVVEVYDLSPMIGGTPTEAKTGNVVLVVSLGEREVGILVDAVSDIIDATEADMRAAPGDKDHATVSSLIRNEDRLIAVLNLQKLFG